MTALFTGEIGLRKTFRQSHSLVTAGAGSRHTEMGEVLQLHVSWSVAMGWVCYGHVHVLA